MVSAEMHRDFVRKIDRDANQRESTENSQGIVGMKLSKKTALIQVLFVNCLLLIPLTCASPREQCEYQEDMEAEEKTCMLTLGVSASCPARIAAGTETAESCRAFETSVLLACALYLKSKDACSDQVDW